MYSFSMALEPSFYYLYPSYPQVQVQAYRSQLPDFSLSLIDQLIRADYLGLLQTRTQSLFLQTLPFPREEAKQYIWLWIDPYSEQHLVAKAPFSDIPLEWPNIQPLDLQRKIISNCLKERLPLDKIDRLTRIEINSIEGIRLKAQANIYTNPKQLQKQVRQIFASIQAFRIGSLRAFQYLSTLFERWVGILKKKDFFKRFYQIKQSDLNKLGKYQLQFKVPFQTWPFVPTSFRQYKQINHYQPTPANRAPYINQRLLSLKQPQECPSDCVCLLDPLPQGQYFCKYSLLSGWQTKCSNRARKVECQHKNPEDQARCRNAEIIKQQRKKCVGKDGQNLQNAEVQQRLTWGIDLYTSHVLFQCLPQFDISQNQKVPNAQRKHRFLQYTLQRALSLIGSVGYSIQKACQFIIENSSWNKKQQTQPKSFFTPILIQQLSIQQNNQKQSSIKIINEKDNNFLFSQKDAEYAQILLDHYQIAIDKGMFRFHTKGKGATCISKQGFKQGTFITQYFGQIYQPWRWYDRQDFIKQIMKKKKIKNIVPQFYNIGLQKHPDQPLGSDMLMVDPSRMGNYSSRFSHSCDPNCGTVITVSKGRYYIGMYAFKDISYGQELTFDYCSMTQSNFQHLNSICLCGMQKCRGNYLQLSNTKIYNNLMDNKNCFFTRNSSILHSAEELTPQNIEVCHRHNIKQGLIKNIPRWLVRWMALVLQFITVQGAVYEKSLIQQWSKNYPWSAPGSQQQKQQNILLYSATNRQQIQNIRLQNLLVSVDKLKFFLSKNELINTPPIFIEENQRKVAILITKEDSVLKELQQCLIRYKLASIATFIQSVLHIITKNEENTRKLSIFRLCCLLVSHQLLLLQNCQFNSSLLSDIIYFYAFTHTYFSATQYKPFQADQICISIGQILGQAKGSIQKKQKTKKKYASPFAWGQMASWFKQTIVCPQASLSQDRRGTLSYPLIRSIMRSEFPYQKQSRTYFHKMLLEKPTNSWPPAPGCDLSFKNPYKLYGTMLFQSVHSRQQLLGLLPKQTLLQSCLSQINSNLASKLNLFRIVQQKLGGISKQDKIYQITSQFISKMEIPIPPIVKTITFTSGEPRKRVKRTQSSIDD